MFEELAKKFEECIEKRTRADSIAKIMLNFKVSFERALEIFDIPKKDYDDYVELLNYFYLDVMKQ